MEYKYEVVNDYSHRFPESEAEGIRKEMLEIIQKHGFGNSGDGPYPPWHPLSLFFDNGTILHGDFWGMKLDIPKFDVDHARTFVGGFFAAPYSKDTYQKLEKYISELNFKVMMCWIRFRCQKLEKGWDPKAYPYAVWVEDTNATPPEWPITTCDGYLNDTLAGNLLVTFFNEYDNASLKTDCHITELAADLGFGYLSEISRMFLFQKCYELMYKK